MSGWYALGSQANVVELKEDKAIETTGKGKESMTGMGKSLFVVLSSN